MTSTTKTPKLSPAQHAIIINWHARIRTQRITRRTAAALMRLGLIAEDWSEPGQYRLTHAGSTLRDRLIAEDRAEARAAALALRAKNDARSAAFADDGQRQRQPKTTRQVFDAHAASLRSGYVKETVSYPSVQSIDDLRWNDALAWPEYHDGFGWQLIPSHTLARWAAFECLDWDKVPAPDMPAPEDDDAEDDDDDDEDDDDEDDDDDGGPLPPRRPSRGQLVELPDGGVARIEAVDDDTVSLSRWGGLLPNVSASTLVYRGCNWWALPDDADADPLADTLDELAALLAEDQTRAGNPPLIDYDPFDGLADPVLVPAGQEPETEAEAVERMIAEEVALHTGDVWLFCPACEGSGAADASGYELCFDCDGAGGCWVPMGS